MIKINNKNRIEFFSRMAQLQKTNMSVIDCLKIVQHDEKIGYVCIYIRRQIEEGKSLFVALKNIRGISNSILNIIYIGEKSGALKNSFEYIADSLRIKKEFKQQVLLAFLYPLIALVFCLIIVVGMFVFVVPQMLKIFSSVKRDLPFTTQVLISIYTFLQDNYIYILSSAAFIFIGVLICLKNQKVKYYFDLISFKIPFIAIFLRDLWGLNFFYSLHLSMKSNASIIDSINFFVTGDNHSLFFKRVFNNISDDIANGKKFSDSLSRNRFIFDSESVEMIRVGETGFGILEMSLYIAKKYENSFKNKLNLISKLTEPILMIFMGLFIGFIVIALFSPLYEITNSIHVR